MRFLIDEDLPRSMESLFRNYGHEAFSIVQVGLRGASDSTVAAYSQTHRLCLVTCDMGFADIRNYPPSEYFGIVVLRLPANATTPVILNLLEKFLKQTEIISEVKEKLAVVELEKIRLRKG